MKGHGATQRRNAANLLLNGLAQTGLQIDITDTTVRTVSSVMASGTGITAGTGDLGAGSGVKLTVNLSEVATVTGTPILSPTMATLRPLRGHRHQCADLQLCGCNKR